MRFYILMTMLMTTVMLNDNDYDVENEFNNNDNM